MYETTAKGPSAALISLPFANNGRQWWFMLKFATVLYRV